MKEKIFLAKRGRPTKYSKETAKRVMHYTKACLNNNEFPTIEHLASYLGVGTRTIYSWEDDYSEFQQTMDILRDAQKHLLITNGLNGKYNSRFASFLLKAIHGFVDSKPVVEATQNNYMNISPDVMAEALKIMEEQDNQSA